MDNHLDNSTVADGSNTPTVDTGNPTPQEAGRTFTQEEVNTIVQDRLGRERAKYADLETRADMAEKQLVLHRFAIPEEQAEKYLKLATLYPNEENDFSKSLAEAIKDFPLIGPIPPQTVAPAHREMHRPTDDPIRKGMGLNRKE